MSIDRLIPISGAGVTGTAFAAAIQEEVTGLWGNSVIPLTDVAGTGDAITAIVAPALTDGLAAGMNFWLIAAADNTGPATIAIGSEDPVDLVDDDGAALSASILKADRRYLLGFDGTAMRVFGTTGQKRIADYQVFTADGTWNKPAGTPDDALIVVELWGGGGGGNASSSTAGGGGGGEYKHIFLRAGDVSATIAVTVGAMAATKVAGNNSSFGSFVTAYGGGTSLGVQGGSGGGPFAKGGNGSSTIAPAGLLAGAGGGGDGYFGGGGGNHAGAGGRSFYGGGGGGGGGADAYPGGVSIYGGNGGADGADGNAPGGGGGRNGRGARGEVRVRTIG